VTQSPGWNFGILRFPADSYECRAALSASAPVFDASVSDAFPSLQTLEKIAQALGVALYQIFFAGNGKPVRLPLTEVKNDDPEETKLVTAFRNLAQKDRRVVLAVAAILQSGS